MFDGDVRKSQLNDICPVLKASPTFIVLPSTNTENTPQNELLNPELEIYNYLINIDSSHPYWTSNTTEFTYRYIRENGPNSSQYGQIKMRDRSKKWFNDHLQYIEDTGAMDYWMQDHPAAVTQFKCTFEEIINKISRKLMIS